MSRTPIATRTYRKKVETIQAAPSQAETVGEAGAPDSSLRLGMTGFEQATLSSFNQGKTYFTDWYDFRDNKKRPLFTCSGE